MRRLLCALIGHDSRWIRDGVIYRCIRCRSRMDLTDWLRS